MCILGCCCIPVYFYFDQSGWGKQGLQTQFEKAERGYGEDEEERELRLALLGSRVTKRAGGEVTPSGGTGGIEQEVEPLQAAAHHRVM